jgi:hypothetical protein
MAKSPSHKFGQDLGNLLEQLVLKEILKPRLEKFAQSKSYYLDWQKERSARKSKKVTWADKYGNKHDLDFVIEVGGTDSAIGKPIAFIEAAWRRYTKHSKNKAQEIQGALLPIVELHHLSAPFSGVVLAGDFTAPALEQLRKNNFSVLYIPYDDVVKAFAKIDFDIAFDESTPDKVYSQANAKLAKLTATNRNIILTALKNISKKETDKFMRALQKTLERYITQIVLVPLFGAEIKLATIDEALHSLGKLDSKKPGGSLYKIEIIVDYSNGDVIRASFKDVDTASEFLNSIKS